MLLYTKPVETHTGSFAPVLTESEVIRNIGQLLRLPLLHVEDDKGWGSVAENPLRELPQAVTPVRKRLSICKGSGIRLNWIRRWWTSLLMSHPSSEQSRSLGQKNASTADWMGSLWGSSWGGLKEWSERHGYHVNTPFIRIWPTL